MGIEIGKRYQVGFDKYIEPTAVKMDLPSGNSYYECNMHRPDGRITTNIYHTYHIQIMIHRYEQKANKGRG